MAVAINSIYSRNNVQATVVAYNSKFKTVVLKFEDGKEQSISTATLAKHWVEVPTTEIPTQEVKIEEEPKVEPVVETPVETKVEEPKEVKVKAKKVAKEKASKVDLSIRDSFRDSLEQSITDMGFTKVKYNGMDNVTLFRQGKKTLIRILYTRKAVSFLVRPSDVPEGVDYTTYKFFLSCNIVKEYSDEAANMIKGILQLHK